MDAWKKEIINYMNEKNISQIEMVEEIRKAGGGISPAGFNHWLNRENSRPNYTNSKAIEKVLNHLIYFYTKPEN